MESIRKTLQWINDNWSAIVGILILAYGVYFKAKKSYLSWKSKSEDEKQIIMDMQIAQAKAQVKQLIINWCFKAEVDFEDYVKSGYTKRAEVLRTIYKELPVLQTLATDDEFIKWVDGQIDEALIVVRETVANKVKETEV